MRSCSIEDEYTVVRELSSSLHLKTHLVRCKDTQETRKCRAIEYLYHTKSARIDLDEAIYDMLRVRCPYMIHYTDVYNEEGSKRYMALLSYDYKCTLEDYLHEQRAKGETIPEPMLWNILVRAVKALRYLHDPAQHSGRVIVHRDVRPGNMYMTDDSVVYLGDSIFCSSYTYPGSHVVGSALTNMAYAPPEIMTSDAYTTAYDIWSLGCSLYELATGAKYSEVIKAAFPGVNYLHALERLQAQPLAIPGYSESLCANLQRMLHIDPAERPTAASLLSLNGSNTSSLASSLLHCSGSC